MKPALDEDQASQERIRGILMDWLAELGGAGKEQVDATEEPRKSDWGSAWSLGMRHPHAHSGGGTCELKPCVIEAVSLTLLELCDFHRDTTGANAAVLEELDRMALDVSEKRLERLEELLRLLIRNHEEVAAMVHVVPLDSTPWPDCEEVLNQARELSLTVETARRKVREGLSTVAARENSDVGKRRRGRLVPAIVEHLRGANVPWKEIAQRLNSGEDSLRKRCEAAPESRTYDAFSY